VKESKVLNFENPEDLTVCLVSLFLSNSKKYDLHSLKVIFAIQGYAGFDEYIMERAKLYLTPNMEAKFYINRPITLEDIEKDNADIVITNYNSFDYDGTVPFHYLQLSTVPTSLDWKFLRQLFESLSTESLDHHSDDNVF
jgi:hypothetical protein